MTLEEASTIRELLNCRDNLITELKEYEHCNSIDGHINDGVNGLGFRWEKNSRQIRYLMNGTMQEIANIEDRILRIQIGHGAERSENGT